jgi:hypothetical protein
MDEQKNFFADSKQAIEKYLHNRLLLIKLQLTEKVSKLAAVIFTGLILAALSFFILLFVSIMAGYYFADLTGSNYSGFGIVAAFYLILLIIIILLRKKVLQKNIINMMIGIMFEKTKDETENEE